MHDNQLYGISERLSHCIDRINKFLRDRPVTFDDLQLYGRGKRFSRYVGPKWSAERNHFQRDIRIRLRTGLGS